MPHFFYFFQSELSIANQGITSLVCDMPHWVCEMTQFFY